MEIADRNYHLRLQEMCDCYLETDFKKQLHDMVTRDAGDMDESAVKYLALAIMYCITERVGKLTVKRKDDKITVKMKGETEITLPSPAPDLFDKMVEVVRSILHIETDKGEMPLALGLRSGDLELQVTIKRKPGKASIKIEFPVL